MQRAAKDDLTWFDNYIGYWQNTIRPELNNPNLYPGFPRIGDFGSDIVAYRNAVQNFYNENPDIMRNLYDRARNRADSVSTGFTLNPTYERFAPGTAAFDSIFNATINSTSFSEGGSRFFDRSALYHTQAEYIFDTTRVGLFRVGGNVRFYRPNSQGTIFSDTNGVVITNREFGIYGGWEKKFYNNKLTAAITMRVDKNQNFNVLASPAGSLVYNVKKDHVLRFSVSSAIRNPTLADQFLYYNVGTARLIGNLNGFDSLASVESFIDYLDTKNIDSVQYFNVAPIRPEKVRTIEFGYRGTLWNKLYVDAGYYFSFYQDFIGFNLGVTFDDARDFGLPATNIQAYRVAANATDMVTTQGFAIGFNYYFHKKYALNGNYSWNRLDLRGSDDPIIPAFNTPEHKFNIGVSARELVLDFRAFVINNVGFNINYKWIQGFQFEGSPQFTGFVPTYGLIDAQVNYTKEDWKTTFKLGASNLLNNQVFQVYGGPVVGRLAYFSVVYDFLKK
jgi:outer membrane receptor protein involved in Fe transport